MKDEKINFGVRRSNVYRSHNAEDRFRSLAEASLSTTLRRLAFLVFCSMRDGKNEKTDGRMLPCSAQKLFR